MSDDERILVLSRLTDGHTPDSVRINADCGCQCWISRSGLKAILSIPTKTSCIQCAGVTPQRLAEMGRQGEARMLPGQREELEEILGEEAVAALMARYHLKEDL